jgi:hypothetical protein
MNGFEFYRVVKQIDPNLNICIMTAYEAIPFDSKFVLKKPFDLTQ